jgi:hypothetical protein
VRNVSKWGVTNEIPRLQSFAPIWPPQTNGADVSDENLKKCAATIDSYGAVSIQRFATNGHGVDRFGPRVFVKTADQTAAELLAATFGGEVVCERWGGFGALTWSWRVTRATAARALRAVLDHLHAKRRQAENALKLYDYQQAHRVIRGRAWTPAAVERYRAECARLYVESMNLNGTAASASRRYRGVSRWWNPTVPPAPAPTDSNPTA